MFRTTVPARPIYSEGFAWFHRPAPGPRHRAGHPCNLSGLKHLNSRPVHRSDMIIAIQRDHGRWQWFAEWSHIAAAVRVLNARLAQDLLREFDALFVFLQNPRSSG